MAGSASPTNTGRRLCCPIPRPVCRRASPPPISAARKTYQTDYLLDQQTVPPGGTATAQARLFAGAKEVRDRRYLRQKTRPQPLRASDRLGLVLFHHQAAVLDDRLAVQVAGQFRARDPRGHRHHQDRVLPARQQILRLDGEDEGGAAADDGNPRALCRRQGQAAAGADGAVQAGEDQSAGRLSADPAADPGLLRALQGAVRHHRNAARAVLRLDQGSCRAGSDQLFQPVRTDPVAIRLRLGVPSDRS